MVSVRSLLCVCAIVLAMNLCLRAIENEVSRISISVCFRAGFVLLSCAFVLLSCCARAALMLAILYISATFLNMTADWYQLALLLLARHFHLQQTNYLRSAH